MTGFTIWVSGTAEDAVEMRECFAEIGAARTSGEGRSARMMRDVAEDKAALLPDGKEGDFAWLAGVLESLARDNPDRLELLRSGIAACEPATKMRKRGPVGGRDAGGRFELTEG